MNCLPPLVAGLMVVAGCPGTAEGETYRFTPQQYHTTYSAAHPPVLRIKPGDRVVTTTVDAFGADASGKTVTSGPNPETGPFYVEGAEPGDTLVVRIERLDTNRTTAFSSSLLAPYVIDPAAIAARTDTTARRVTWDIDKEHHVVRLDAPDVVPRGIELPLVPMLGCIAVAPARNEAFLSTTPGPFGGNMDYAGLNAGVTVLLPVNEPGALLFVGDGHARQGAGEVLGQALETSMDVEFSVDLIKKKTIAWPRMENGTHILVLGSARPLLEAFQHATTEMQRWLQSDYGFSERGAALLMGQALEYDIANVVDPTFTVVARIDKRFLR
jgi:acetamidase/formamidase